MVELSSFVGQLLSDLAGARAQADSYAASVSELYHADPFVKNLPVPHYIIESAEIDVPVMVVGITKSSDEFDSQREKLRTAMSEKLPVIIMRNYKYSFVKSHEERKQKEEEKSSSRAKLRKETTGGGEEDAQPVNPFEAFDAQFSEEQLQAFEQSAQTITEKVTKSVIDYVDNYNYDLIKVLDLTDEFIKYLRREIRHDMSNYTSDNRPYANKAAINSAVQFMGNLMFFEFKSIMRSAASVQVDIDTVQMNEYATRDCLMHIKLNVKEQDLSLMVEEDSNGKERRFLSLS